MSNSLRSLMSYPFDSIYHELVKSKEDWQVHIPDTNLYHALVNWLVTQDEDTWQALRLFEITPELRRISNGISNNWIGFNPDKDNYNDETQTLRFYKTLTFRFEFARDNHLFTF